jgi:hypothetical protein
VRVTLPVTVPDSEKPSWLAEMLHTVEPGPFFDATWVIDCPSKVKVRSKARGWKTAHGDATQGAARRDGYSRWPGRSIRALGCRSSWPVGLFGEDLASWSGPVVVRLERRRASVALLTVSRSRCVWPK